MMRRLTEEFLMARGDWYRNKKWNEHISDAFFVKLNRARSQKMQYLVIQSGYLKHKYPKVTLTLLKLYFEQRIDKFFDNSAYNNQAEAYIKIKEIDKAIIAYKNVLKRESVFPNCKTNTAVEYPYFIAVNGIEKEYENILNILNKTDESILIWPVNLFQWHAAYAIINNDKLSAQKAIEIAKINKSVLRYHQKLGLVGREHNKTIKCLKKIIKRIT